jgi:C-terminal processing protease CtpA/Prc
MLVVGMMLLAVAFAGCGPHPQGPDQGQGGDDQGAAYPDGGDGGVPDVALDSDGGSDLDLGDAGGCPDLGVTRCQGRAVATCQAQGDGLSWSDPVPCGNGQVCRDQLCQAPSPTQRQQLDDVALFVANMAARTGWLDDFNLDLAGLTLGAQTEILDGDGTVSHFYAALRLALLGFPTGHAALFSATECGTLQLPYQDTSRLGVCARPLGDGMVVTHVTPGNPLGLLPGDQVLDADGVSGTELVQRSLLRPVCGNSSATESHMRTTAATSFFGTVPEGTTLTILPADGSPRRTVTVPGSNQALLDCRDPMGKDTAFDARAELRPDGVAVIRLPRFFPIEGQPDDPPDQLMMQMEQAVQTAFDSVKDAPGLVWDLRANVGGITQVALDIVAGMPGARAVPTLAHCQSRIPFQQPVAFYPESAVEYAVTPGGSFAYAGKVAVLVDGLAISAADYFARAVKLATDVPVVGSPPAGAYGGGDAEFSASDDPSLTGVADPARCDDGSGVPGVPLEGQATVPDLTVEPTPADLAAGVDTQLEAAVSLVRQ